MPDGGFDLSALLASGAKGPLPMPSAAPAVAPQNAPAAVPAQQASTPSGYHYESTDFGGTKTLVPNNLPQVNLPQVPFAAPQQAEIVVGGAHPAPASQVVPSSVAVPPTPAPAPTQQDQPFDVGALLSAGSQKPLPMPVAPPSSGKMSGLLANIGAGTSDAVAGGLGGAVDLATGALNLIPRGINAIAGTHIPTIDHPVGGSDWWRSAEGLIGADPRNVVPATEIQKMARAGGNAAGSMLLPWGAANALKPLAGVPGALQRTFGAGGAPTMAAAGLVGGAAGQGAEDMAPAPYKPMANLAGNLVGGALPIGIAAAAHGAIDAAAPAVRNFVAPMTRAGQTGLAAQRVAGAAHDLGAVRDTLDAAAAADAKAAPHQAVLADPNATPAAKAAAQQRIAAIPGRTQIVPGSQPTTFQLTGDQGLGQLERAVAAPKSDLMIDRNAAQNQARVNALEGTASGSPEAVGAAFRARLAALDAQHGAEAAAAQQNAQGATTALGGAVPVGADAQTTALQSFGQRLRSGLAGNDDAAKKAVGRLYDAVDPAGTLAVDTSGIKAAAREIGKDIPKNAAPMEGDAGRILGVAQMQPKVVLFKEIAALRSRITDAMRTELYANGKTATYRTLTRLLAAVDDTLANGVEKAAAADASIQSRLTDAEGVPSNELGAGSRSASVDGQEADRNAAGIAGAGGKESDGGQRSGTGHSDSAVAVEPAVAGSAPGEPDLTPNFDADAAAAYRKANTAHAERMQTFHEAPGVGQVLAAGKRAGEWKLGDSQVASTIFNSGKGAAERIQAFLKAGGDRADLQSDIKDYAAFSLRRAAEDANGTLEPKAYQRWIDAHREAMSAFPDLAAKFDTAAKARTALDETMAAHAAARKAFEQSAAKKFLGDADPVMTMGSILKGNAADATMRELANLTKNAPEARVGMQRAVIDYILGEVRSNSLAGQTEVRQLKNDALLTFLRKADGPMQHIFSPEQVRAIRDVATDIQRTQRSVTGTKLPGGSNTAQDLAAGAKHGGHKPSMIGSLVALEVAGEAAEHMSGLGVIGKAGGMLGAIITKAMRESGMAKVDDLVAEAMMHPELARALLAKVPAPAFARPVMRNAARQILATSGLAAARMKEGNR